MRILLDTHVFLWLVTEDDQLSKKAKSIFLEEKNDLFLSLASIWEMAIKVSLGKLTLKQSIQKFIPNQLSETGVAQLDITFKHVIKVAELPFHHRDPFDRLIISQAIEEDLAIVSSDKEFDKYDIKRLW